LKKGIDARKESIQAQIKALARTNKDVLNDIDALELKIEKLNALTVKDKYSREETLDFISKFVIKSEVIPFITKKDKRESSKVKPIITYELRIFDDIARV
jgi:site-specific DNA recombinase